MKDNGSLIRHEQMRKNSIYNQIFSSIDIAEEQINHKHQLDEDSEVTIPKFSQRTTEKKNEEEALLMMTGNSFDNDYDI